MSGVSGETGASRVEPEDAPPDLAAERALEELLARKIESQRARDAKPDPAIEPSSGQPSRLPKVEAASRGGAAGKAGGDAASGAASAGGEGASGDRGEPSSGASAQGEGGDSSDASGKGDSAANSESAAKPQGGGASDSRKPATQDAQPRSQASEPQRDSEGGEFAGGDSGDRPPRGDAAKGDSAGEPQRRPEQGAERQSAAGAATEASRGEPAAADRQPSSESPRGRARGEAAPSSDREMAAGAEDPKRADAAGTASPAPRGSERAEGSAREPSSSAQARDDAAGSAKASGEREALQNGSSADGRTEGMPAARSGDAAAVGGTADATPARSDGVHGADGAGGSGSDVPGGEGRGGGRGEGPSASPGSEGGAREGLPRADDSAAEPRSGSRVRIELPEVDTSPIQRREVRDRTDQPREREPRWVLRGAWEQIDPQSNFADYAPGGYRRCVILIDPDAGSLRVYRLFGRDGGFSIAGEFTLEMWPDGTLLLGSDPAKPHRFPQSRLELPDGAAVEPPVSTPEGLRRWSIREGVLELDGKRFSRIGREEFDAVARGSSGSASPAAGAVAAGGEWPPRRAGGDDASADRAIDFFGTRIVGRYVCFVVDVSGSMAGPRLEAALREIARSIDSLPEDRFFFVLFFSGGKFALQDAWLRATPRNRREFNGRLPLVQAQGGTEPRDAIEHAFRSLNPVPDEIHFMTDGLVPADTPEVIRNLNRGRARTVVHTYAFGERASEAMLDAIAREHAGSYRFVP